MLGSPQICAKIVNNMLSIKILQGFLSYIFLTRSIFASKFFNLATAIREIIYLLKPPNYNSSMLKQAPRLLSEKPSSEYCFSSLQIYQKMNFLKLIFTGFDFILIIILGYFWDITILGPQIVDTLFIVRLRPNMSMRHAAIINY